MIEEQIYCSAFHINENFFNNLSLWSLLYSNNLRKMLFNEREPKRYFVFQSSLFDTTLLCMYQPVQMTS